MVTSVSSTGSAFSVDGLISGLKTSDLISGLLSIEQAPITLLQNQQSQATDRQKAVLAIQAQVTAFQSTISQLLNPARLSARAATVDATGSVAVSATANDSAIPGTFNVTVSQLATATKAASGAPIGQVINRTALLGSAGFAVPPIVTSNGSPATFSINGVSIAVDGSSTLDDGTANSVISKINAAGAGVTASLIADADGRANNRIQLVSNPGQSIQLGALGGDTSNVLNVLNLTDAQVQGYTASNVASGAVAAGALSTSIMINGVTTTINQSNAAFTSQQNAAAIATAINGTAGSTVRATDNGDGTFTLQQKTLGSQQAIDITAADASTGLTVAATRNGTDRAVSTRSLGTTSVNAPLDTARLVTPISGLDGSGNGQFTVNGVAINYRGTDSVSAIIGRINSSSAGVSAFYDVVQDRIRLVASTTGARSISLQDVTGNFLGATGLLSASQAIGQQAVFSIDSVNNGQPLTSSSNSVTGYVPGVTLQLKATTTQPATVSVSPDTSQLTILAGQFVDGFNSLMDLIDQDTSYDATTKASGILAGDTGIQDIERNIRSMVSSAQLGAGGSYRSLRDIGIGTGAIGSAVGTTSHLQLDQTKLAATLQNDPNAVKSVLSAFQASVGTPTGTGNITAVSGAPTEFHEDGTYYVKLLDTSGNAEIRFVTTDGRQLVDRTTSIAPGTQNSFVIPGVTLSTNSSLAVGEDSFSISVSQKGVMVGSNDFLTQLLSPDGFFASRKDASDADASRSSKQIADMQARLTQKQADLQAKFAALESTMAQLQAQSNALASQIARLSPSSGG